MPKHRKTRTTASDPEALGTKLQSISINDETTAHPTKPGGADAQLVKPPPCWPNDVQYIGLPDVSPFLSEEQKAWLQRKPPINSERNNDEICDGSLPIIRLPLTRLEVDARVEVRVIEDNLHPAYGQRGLFAARDLAPDEVVLPYVGYVHSSTASEKLVHQSFVATHNSNSNSSTDFTTDDRIGTWDTSSYDLNLYRDETIEVAVDAARMGNEARFCNDYRGVPTSDPTTNPKGKWDRNTKRAAKGWTQDTTPAADNGDNQWSSNIAIPNAEFRDVWFEWQIENDVVEHKLGSLVFVSAPRTQDERDSPDEIGLQNLSFATTAPVASQTPELSSDPRKHARRKRKRGMRGVAIFVLPAGKTGKRKHGIRCGQELLVSYGKGFWAHHGL